MIIFSWQKRTVAENTEIKKKYTEVEAENVKLRQAIEENTAKEYRGLVILEQGEENISTEEVSQSPVNSNDTSERIVSQCEDIPISNISDNTPNSNSISLEEKEENEFLDSKYKEEVSKEIRERNREAKLLISDDVLINSGQSHKKKTTQDIVQDVFDFTTTSPKNHLNFVKNDKYLEICLAE
ncbi:hypothetical protein Glove_2g18 [Diversispora epigaea]|uniref:Uncharacterized protein n=1 Tax=Diversispora epigaea TaxID=1348612 RepID=A0A397JRD8_9GLOM|nr:hypothetical protein Glove_2g18 [Diversispora epigaea]